MVGEIFCRLNTFANNDLIRQIEAQGGECWLADIGEWVWYTNDEQRRRLTGGRKRFGKDNAIRFIKSKVMRMTRQALRRRSRRTSSGTRSRTTCARCSR